MGVRIFGIAGSSNPAEDFRLAASGIFVPASALNNRTGVTSLPVLTGTGSLTCTIGAFSCLVDGTSNAMQGSYWATLDSAATVTITTGAAQARIDLISLQIRDNAYDGGSHEDGLILYTAGTPGSGVAPTAPANTISLFTVAVPANATTLTFSTAATAVFPFTAAAGGIVPVRSAADKPAVASGVQYRHRLDVTATVTGVSPLESSTDGVTWTPVSSGDSAYGTWTNATVGSLLNVSIQPQYRTAPGNRVELRGALNTNSTLPDGYGVIGALPSPAANRTFAFATNGPAAYLVLPTSGGVASVHGGSSIPTNIAFGFDGVSYSL